MTYKKDQFYIIRAERAGVFLCKILKADGNTLKGRLYTIFHKAFLKNVVNKSA